MSPTRNTKPPDNVDCVKPILASFLKKPSAPDTPFVPTKLPTPDPYLAEVYNSNINFLEATARDDDQEQLFSLADEDNNEYILKHRDLYSPKVPVRLLAGKASLCKPKSKEKDKANEEPKVMIMGARCHTKGFKRKEILIDLDNKKNPVTILNEESDRNDSREDMCSKKKSVSRGKTMKQPPSRAKKGKSSDDSFCPQMKGGSASECPFFYSDVEKSVKKAIKVEKKYTSRVMSRQNNVLFSPECMQPNLRPEFCLPSVCLSSQEFKETIAIPMARTEDKMRQSRQNNTWENQESSEPSQMSIPLQRDQNKLRDVKQSKARFHGDENRAHYFEGKANERLCELSPNKRHEIAKGQEFCLNKREREDYERRYHKSPNERPESHLADEMQRKTRNSKETYNRNEEYSRLYLVRDEIDKREEKLSTDEQQNDFFIAPPQVSAMRKRSAMSSGNKVSWKDSSTIGATPNSSKLGCHNCGTLFCHPIPVLFTARTIRYYIKKSLRDPVKYIDWMRGGYHQGVIINNVKKLRRPAKEEKRHESKLNLSDKELLIEMPVKELSIQGDLNCSEASHKTTSVTNSEDMDSLRKQAIELDYDTNEELLTDKEDKSHPINFLVKAENINPKLQKTRMAVERINATMEKGSKVARVEDEGNRDLFCPCVQLYLKGLNKEGKSSSDTSGSKYNTMSSLLRKKEEYPDKYGKMASQEMIWAKKLAQEKNAKKKVQIDAKTLTKYGLPLEYFPTLKMMKNPVIAKPSSCRGGGYFHGLSELKHMDDLYLCSPKMLSKYFIPVQMLPSAGSLSKINSRMLSSRKLKTISQEMATGECPNCGSYFVPVEGNENSSEINEHSSMRESGDTREDYSREELTSQGRKKSSARSSKHIIDNDEKIGNFQTRKTVVFQSEIDIQPIKKSLKNESTMLHQRKAQPMKNTSSSELGSKTMLNWLRGLKENTSESSWKIPQALNNARFTNRSVDDAHALESRENTENSYSVVAESDESVYGNQHVYEDEETGTKIIMEGPELDEDD